MQDTPYTVIYIKNFTHKLQVLHIQFYLFFLLDKPVQMQLKKIAGCITCDSHFALRSQKKKEKKKLRASYKQQFHGHFQHSLLF